jgi:AcrR family transcriptional regulator
VSQAQRARILSATVGLVVEVGYARMSVERVVRRAGVSRRTFHECFADLEDCFLALLEFLEHEPDVSTLVLVEALGAGPKVLRRRVQAIEKLKLVLEEGGYEQKTGVSEVSPLTAEGAVNAVFGILHTRMVEENPSANGRLIELVNPLVAMIVLPYVGHAVAANELARSSPERGPPKVSRPAGLNMRLTYRTSMVLSAIAELGGRGSGPSNQEIADAAGIRDQGQISRLLKRLRSLGLIENTVQGWGKPNAWRLTAKGDEVRHELEAHTGDLNL